MDRPGITASSKWVFAGTVLSKPIQLFTSVMIARLLGPSSFGVFGLATSMAVTLALIAGLGLGDASNKYVAEYYSRDREKGRRFSAIIIWSATIFSTLLFVALWLQRPWWVGVVFPDSTTTIVIALSLCLAWTNLIFALLAGVISGLQLFREFAILSVLQAFAVAVFAVVLSFYGAEGALLAYVVGSVITLSWAVAKILQTDPGLFSWPRLPQLGELKRILRFSTPIWIGAFALNPVITFAFVFLARQPNGEHHLGMLNTANGLRTLVTVLPGVIAVVITPALIQEGGLLGERHSYNQLLEKSFSALVFLTLPLLIVCLFLGDLMFLIYGKAYGDSYRLFLPLVTSATVGAIGTPLVIAMMAKNLTGWSLGFGVAKSILLIGLTLWWVPSQFSIGLAWAFFVSEAFFYVLALEFCVGIGAVPRGTRSVFYSATTASVVLLILALWLPASVRWGLAAPFSALLAVYLLRAHPMLSSWLTHLVPGPLQSGTERILKLITAPRASARPSSTPSVPL